MEGGGRRDGESGGLLAAAGGAWGSGVRVGAAACEEPPAISPSLPPSVCKAVAFVLPAAAACRSRALAGSHFAGMLIAIQTPDDVSAELFGKQRAGQRRRRPSPGTRPVRQRRWRCAECAPGAPCRSRAEVRRGGRLALAGLLRASGDGAGERGALSEHTRRVAASRRERDPAGKKMRFSQTRRVGVELSRSPETRLPQAFASEKAGKGWVGCCWH